MSNRTLLLFLLCLLLVPAAFADSVVTSSNGGAFTLGVTNLSGTTYEVTVTADFSQTTGPYAWTGGSLYVYGIDFAFGSVEVSGTPTFISSTLASAYWANSYQGMGSLTGGPIGTDGCQANSQSNFACFQLPQAHFNADPTTGLQTWVWDVTYANVLTDADLMAPNDHLGMLFVNSDGHSSGILSTPIDTTPPTEHRTPEPASLLILGTSFLGVAGVLRRKTSV